MERRLRILHLEDLNSDAILVHRALKRGHLDFEKLVVDTREKYIDALNHFFPDIILSDHSLPSFNSHEALTIFHETNLKIPFILITATISEEFAVDILQRGADDYILKDRLERLPNALKNALEKFRLAKDLEQNLSELIESETRLRDLMESIGDGFFALDKDWIVTYWNKEAETILKKTKEETIGKSMWALFPETLGTITQTNFYKAARENTVQNYERFNEVMNHWLELSIYPSPNGMSVYVKNITERRLAEMERTKMVDEILQRNKDLEQFSYIVSHNLRAPLANIIGLSEELNGEKLEQGEIKNLSNFLVISAKQLDNVILDLNHVLQVKREINENKELVVLSELIGDILTSIPNLIIKERVRLVVDFSEADEMWTLKSYLHSIFYNLISNSIKYRQADRAPLIKIESAKSGEKTIITYTDNGIGIDLVKYEDQLFGIYKRFHNHVEGKGLGLFMVKTQVETLQGKIKVQSEVNKGTKFIIEFG